jgi:outer membrane lipoprotein-sorting protein
MQFLKSSSTFLAAVLLATAGTSLFAQEQNPGLAIAIEADKRSNGFIDSSATMTMTLTNRRGDSSERELRVRALEVENDGDMSLTIFDTPADVKGTALLTHSHKIEDDDQWLYIPALRRVKRMSSSKKSGPFMGSEFSFEDLSSQEVEKYQWKLLGEEQLEGMATYKLERIPVDKDSGYTKQIVWMDKVEYRVLKVDYYDRKKSLLKTLTNKDYRLYQDKFWRAHDMLMINHQTGKKTQLLWDNIQYQNGYSEADFNKNSLKRIR